MSDFRVLMVLYKEDFGDVARIHMKMDVVEAFQKYLESCLYTDGKHHLSIEEYRNMCKIEHFLNECVRTEKEQNRLENKSV